ncbi:SurF1 family protein [Bartonella australis AUST/NH1]|uniref:SURF1-like protein n=1 Tax=Bartonella australis (strain Aust/NH1) TaxID=1094489 RepID=M1PEN1_BARAA|nr:SURF1 family protein [Bartonella australis]AGF75096.1 SurF1 family protein [Bartonella australis AUST/NH1]
MTKTDQPAAKHKHKNIKLYSILLYGSCIFFFFVFSALGLWQIQRLNWKLNLITSANKRVYLHPIKAPPQTQWAHITFDTDEYRPVTITGKFLINKNILVTAVTQNTTGYWVLAPLQRTDGTLTFVNRGFIPMDARHRFQRHEQLQKSDALYHHFDTETEPTTITGFLRMSEKNGIFPRKNNPEQDLWYTRQLPAMAQKLGLPTVAPYFIDANTKTTTQDDLPITGLTVVQFRNNHLTYAITWFILAAGVLSAFLFLLRYKD